MKNVDSITLSYEGLGIKLNCISKILTKDDVSLAKIGHNKSLSLNYFNLSESDKGTGKLNKPQIGCICFLKS
ncbi:hypothetical protein, partial [Clostridium sp.]|uniref:hypothetical protein n=1 Tax=Clostridium sp. TaxID=1506 RepID=UPI002FDE1ADE